MKLSRCKLIFNTVKSLPAWIRNVLLRLYIARKSRVMTHQQYPNNITLFVTNRCNMACDHCFLKGKTSEEMTTQQIMKLAKSMKGIITNRLIITGGEPFLRPDLRTITQAFIDSGVKRIQVATTGWYTDRIIKYALQFKDEVDLSFQFSYDGPEERHDKVRKKGAWKRLWYTCGELKKIGFKGDITMVSMVSKENVKYLPAMIKATRQFGYIHEFNFDRTLPALPDYFDEAVAVINKYYYGRQTDLYRIMAKYKFDYIREWYCTGKKWCPGTHSLQCTAGHNDCVIWPNGSIGRCELWDSTELQLSSFDYNFKETFDGKNKYWAARNCWCNHDCNIINSMPYNFELLKRMFLNDK